MMPKNAALTEVWESVEALRQSVKAGYIKPGRDETATLLLADEIDRLGHEVYDLIIAQTELGGALRYVLDMLPDPHLNPDKEQAHYVREARAVLDAYEPGSPFPELNGPNASLSGGRRPSA